VDASLNRGEKRKSRAAQAGHGHITQGKEKGAGLADKAPRGARRFAGWYDVALMGW
jgi:hypothetical protein